jgi:hypothetical protein
MVTPSNVMRLISDASIAEATLGKPPFAIFLSSAGNPSGQAAYPAIDAHGNATFPPLAQQPPCPPGGFVLTFTSPNGGATDTRKLQCNAVVYGNALPNPSPTPNPPKIEPTAMVAHWTTDVNASGGPLKFKVVAYGYYHWYASDDGNGCALGSSQNGGAPATFTAGWPWAPPQRAGEASLAPLPPNAPYTWPNGDPNDPPAWFTMQPVHGNPGYCTIGISDAYGQTVGATIQVMGDLAISGSTLQAGTPPVMTFTSPTAAAQTITAAKTYDTEALILNESGACGGIVTVSNGASSVATSISSQATTQQLTIAPLKAGTCVMAIGDQYGEPPQLVEIIVQAKSQPFATWPQQLVLGAGGVAMGKTSGALAATARNRDPFVALAPWVNMVLGGSVARAAGGADCYALGETLAGSVDTTLPSQISAQLGIYADSNGCLVDGNDNPLPATSIAMIAYEPLGSGQTGTFAQNGPSCSAIAYFGSWSPNLGRNDTDAALPTSPGTTGGTCILDISDGASTQSDGPDSGAVQVVVDAACVVGQVCGVLDTGTAWSEPTTGCSLAVPCTSLAWEDYNVSTDGGVTWTLQFSDHRASADVHGVPAPPALPGLPPGSVVSVSATFNTPTDGGSTTATDPAAYTWVSHVPGWPDVPPEGFVAAHPQIYF